MTPSDKDIIILLNSTLSQFVTGYNASDWPVETVLNDSIAWLKGTPNDVNWQYAGNVTSFLREVRLIIYLTDITIDKMIGFLKELHTMWVGV